MLTSRSALLRLCAAGIFVALTGCGGGSDAGSPAPTPTALPPNTTRTLQVGDRWTYRYTSSLYGGAQVTQTVESRSDSGQIGYRIVSDEHTARYVTESQLLQDTDASIYLLRQHRSVTIPNYDEAGSREFDEGAVTYPRNYPFLFGTWRKGDILAYLNPPFDAAPTPSAPYVPDREYRIVGIETVTVPAGRFDTWKVQAREGGFESTIWYAPQIGSFVKRTGTAPGYGPVPHRSARMSAPPPYKYEMVLTETSVTP